jgi:hypothetical protein
VVVELDAVVIGPLLRAVVSPAAGSDAVGVANSSVPRQRMDDAENR